jgi:4-hydroxy-tetrahydrodipicolinate reductase
MGKAVEEAAAGMSDFTIKARIDRVPATSGAPTRSVGSKSGGSGYDTSDGAGHDATREELVQVLERGDVVVDFSGPDGTRAAATACAEQGASLVSGTTGLTAPDLEAVESAARRVAVLRAANFSLGVLALRRLVGVALQSLPPDWDVEIVERHHRLKADSPSGTALQLAREAAQRRGTTDAVLRFGRQGTVGPRTAEEIGVHAIRGGTWVGDHTVLVAGSGEWIELRHVAQDRGAFARGALEAARFVVTALPGLYSLEDLYTPSS